MESHRQRHRMMGATRHSQAGVTALGFLILTVLFGAVGYAGLKVVPMYIKQMRMNTEAEAWECPEVKPYDRRGSKPISVNDVIPLQVVNA